MLKWRLILGTLFIAMIAGACWLDYSAPRAGIYLLPLAALLSLLGAGELLVMFNKRGHQPLPWVVYGGVMLTVLSAGVPVFAPGWAAAVPVGGLGWLAAGFTAALLLSIVGELGRYQSPPAQSTGPGEASAQVATTNLALSVFAIAYVGGLMGFLILLRLFNRPPWGNDGHWGMVAIISLLVTVKMSDIGQYTVGRLLGRRKLAPTISPGKTWEGALGGVAFAVVAAWLVFHGAAQLAPAPIVTTPVGLVAADRTVATVGFAIAVAATGILGDLAESMLKRDAGMKDSSTWMPGFGGVLDLLDSLLGAAPVAYWLWVAGIVGP